MKSKVSQNGKHVVIKTGLQVIYELLLWLDVQTNQYRTSKHDDLDTKKRIGKGIQKVYNMRTMFQRTSLQKRSSRQKASRFTYSSK
jgi:hypothetical protein